MVTVLRDLARTPGFARSAIIAVLLAAALVTVLAVLLTVPGHLVSFYSAYYHGAGRSLGAP